MKTTAPDLFRLLGNQPSNRIQGTSQTHSPIVTAKLIAPSLMVLLVQVAPLGQSLGWPGRPKWCYDSQMLNSMNAVGAVPDGQVSLKTASLKEVSDEKSY